MKEQLDMLELPFTCTLLQYIDDLLIAADSEEASKEGTESLLIHLAEHGHKASLKEFQHCRQEVAYLGYLLSKEGRRLIPECIQSISDMSVPNT